MPNIEAILEETLNQVDLEPVVQVQKATSLRKTIEKINKHWVRAAIITEEGKPLGLLTQRDILRRIALNDVNLEQSVEQMMSAVPGTLTLRSTLKEAIDMIIEHHRRSIPIIEESGNTIGIVTSRALVNHVAAHFPRAVYNLPPNPHQTSIVPEGA